MYIDDTVIASLITVGASLVIGVGIGVYAIKDTLQKGSTKDKKSQ